MNVINFKLHFMTYNRHLTVSTESHNDILNISITVTQNTDYLMTPDCKNSGAPRKQGRLTEQHRTIAANGYTVTPKPVRSRRRHLKQIPYRERNRTAEEKPDTSTKRRSITPPLHSYHQNMARTRSGKNSETAHNGVQAATQRKGRGRGRGSTGAKKPRAEILKKRTTVGGKNQPARRKDRRERHSEVNETERLSQDEQLILPEGERDEIGETHFRMSRSRTINKIGASLAEINIHYNVTTAVECPCEKEECRTLIRVGKYFEMGSVSDVCVHCGKGRADGGVFRHGSDLNRHVGSLSCQKAQGLSPKPKSGYHMLGLALRHLVNDPENYTLETVDGKEKERFKCPKCEGNYAWSKRYQHAVECFPKHGLKLPKDASTETDSEVDG